MIDRRSWQLQGDTSSAGRSSRYSDLSVSTLHQQVPPPMLFLRCHGFPRRSRRKEGNVQVKTYADVKLTSDENSIMSEVQALETKKKKSLQACPFPLPSFRKLVDTAVIKPYYKLDRVLEISILAHLLSGLVSETVDSSVNANLVYRVASFSNLNGCCKVLLD